MIKLMLCVLCFQIIKCHQIYRLGTDVRPYHYNITIKPDFEIDAFDGWVSIDILVDKQRPNITLNGVDLNITEVLLDDEPVEFLHDNHEQIITVYPVEDKLIMAGNHTIKITYGGRVSIEDERGLKKATFNENMYLYTCDFEPIGARYVFPCFDEPNLKAKFSIKLISNNSSMVGISNMPEISKDVTNEGTVHVFETSVPMSSYLVCIIFSDFPYEEQNVTVFDKPVRLRIYSKETDHDSQFNITQRALEFYTIYTNMTDPLKKIDLIEYNKRGAGTENWGLITFKLGILSSSLGYYDDYQANHVISHEIGHSWFGNLVTNKWWDDIWLQESLVSFLTQKATVYVSGDKEFSWRMYDDQRADQLFEAVMHPVETYDELQNIFTDIIYKKGTNIFKMIASINPDSFQQALRSYLTKFQYSSANTNDFISILEETDGTINWKEFIESFIKQTGYPQILIKKENDSYVLTQKCWAKEKESQCSGNRWTIPITYSTDTNDEEELVWFFKDQDVLRIPVNGSKIIVLNKNNNGYYRFNYEDQLWDTLENIIDKLDLNQQRTITKEADLLYESGIIDCSISLRLMKNLESKSRIWNYLVYDLRRVQNPEARDYISTYISQLSRNRNEIKRFWFSDSAPPQDETKLKNCISWIKQDLPDTSENSIDNNV